MPDRHPDPPRKPHVYARRLWNTMQVRGVNSTMVATLIGDVELEPRITKLISSRRQRTLDTTSGKPKHSKPSRATDDTRVLLKRIARALLVDPDWLYGDDSMDWAFFITSDLRQAEEVAIDPDDQLGQVSTWLRQADETWTKMLNAEKDALRQGKILALLRQMKAAGTPWPTYHRRDLVHTGGWFTGVVRMTPRSVPYLFSLDQVLALADILVHGKPPPDRDMIDRYIAWRGEFEPSVVLEVPDADAGIATTVAARFPGCTYAALMRQFDDAQATTDQEALPELWTMMDWAFRTEFPDDERQSLPDVLTTYRKWRVMRMRRAGEREEEEANAAYTLDDFCVQYQRRIISTDKLHQALAKVVPHTDVKKQEEAVADLELRLRAVDALIQRGTGYVLVPDAEDRSRWLRWKTSAAVTV